MNWQQSRAFVSEKGAAGSGQSEGGDNKASERERERKKEREGSTESVGTAEAGLPLTFFVFIKGL